jgi:hypothetical protein
MGYFVKCSGRVVIESHNIQNFCLAVRMMLNDTRSMSGGTWENGKKISHNYSWVDSDQLMAACRKFDIEKIFRCWGFDVIKNDSAFAIYYDNKTGDEDKFINKIAPWIKEGEIIWKGEEGESWKQEFKNGVMRTLRAQTSWV